MQRVFVSGGAGVIGLELVPKLCALGAAVFVGDLKPRPAGFPQSVQYRQGDLNTLTAQEFAAFAPDVFIHLAATFERSTESYEFWSENFRHNVQLSHHLMTLAKDSHGLQRVVFASSYLIYLPSLYQFPNPSGEAISLRETDPVLPRNLTGMAKLAHEIELGFLDTFRASQFTSVCARIFRGYGRGSRDVISRWIRSLLQDEPVTLYRPEGMFDYVYAADTAEGLIRLAQAPVSGIINLGTGRSRRVSEVIEVLRKHFPAMKVSVGESDIPFEASQADVTHLRGILGWTPTHDLERAIPLIIEYERNKLASTSSVAAVRPPRVLVTSSSRKVPLIRALQAAARAIHPEASVIAGDMDPEALSFHVADRSWTMPRLADDVLNVLLEKCRELGVTTILPTRDGELLFWSQHAASFAESGVEVIVSEPAALKRCLDKLAFSKFGADEKISLIPSALAIDDLTADRFVVKERFGAGSRSIGIDLDRTMAVAHAATLQEPIFQPFVAGHEISIDAWLSRKSVVKGLILRRRNLVVGGESQVTTTFRDAELEAQAASILNRLSLRGPVVMQVIIDSRGGMNVIECNPRFGGASTTSIAAGLDSLRWSLLEAGGADPDGYPFVRARNEVRQVRVPTDVHFHGPDL